MTEYHLIYTVFAAILIAAVFSSIVTFFIWEMIEIDVEIKTFGLEMKKTDLAKSVEKCLKNEKEYIEELFLDANDGENLCDLCGICNIKASAKVKNYETGRIWIFGKGGNEINYIFINIMKNGETNIGELNVQV